MREQQPDEVDIQQKQAKKPKPYSVDEDEDGEFWMRGLLFHVENATCQGHWIDVVNYDAVCTDCKEEESCMYGVCHCCCDACEV